MCPSFCCLELLQSRACPLTQAKRARADHTLLPGSKPPAWPRVHGAASPAHDAQQSCGLELEAAPGTEGRVCSALREMSGGHYFRPVRADLLSGNVASSPLEWGQACCYGMDTSSLTAAEPTALKSQEQFPNDIGHCP